jgi:lysylphosphatidylglycerol synthetase-like protein (DUF2156 family)
MLLVLFSLIINIVILVFGIQTKNAENLGLFQTLPTIFMFLLFQVGLEVQDAWIQTPDSEGFGFGLLVVLPTMFFTIISTTTLGIMGLVRMKSQGSLFLKVLSMLSATSLFTYTLGFFAFPSAFIIILFIKAKRKRKRDKALNIID